MASGSGVCLDGRGKHFLTRSVAIGQEAERLSLRKAKYKDVVNSDVCSWIFCWHESAGNLGNDSDTLMAARSQPNDNWGSVGNGAKHGEKHVGGGSGM